MLHKHTGMCPYASFWQFFKNAFRPTCRVGFTRTQLVFVFVRGARINAQHVCDSAEIPWHECGSHLVKFPFYKVVVVVCILSPRHVHTRTQTPPLSAAPSSRRARVTASDIPFTPMSRARTRKVRRCEPHRMLPSLSESRRAGFRYRDNGFFL